MSASENQIIVYQPNETVRLDVRLENETVWLTQLKIAELFGVQKAAISKHVRNIFVSGELAGDATVSKMETVQTEGGRSVVRTQEFFNLDVIIAVGYRVNSQRAMQFRIWAKKELIVIDAYPGVATLDMLAKRGRGVKIELVTHSNGELAESDFEAFGKQCGKFTKTICGICHDRFIIVDQKEIFWKMRRRNAHAFRRGDSAKAEPEGRTSVRGASFKDAGRLTFAAAKMYPPSEASCEAGSMRGARRLFPDFSIQSARRHLNDGNTAKVRRRQVQRQKGGRDLK